VYGKDNAHTHTKPGRRYQRLMGASSQRDITAAEKEKKRCSDVENCARKREGEKHGKTKNE
jgi:hypothetical protein